VIPSGQFTRRIQADFIENACKNKNTSGGHRG
jgi:hypothetical protein